jgi:hypothetical protein
MLESAMRVRSAHALVDDEITINSESGMPDEVKTRRVTPPWTGLAPFHVIGPLSLRVFPFEQTHLDNTRQISRLNRVVR